MNTIAFSLFYMLGTAVATKPILTSIQQNVTVNVGDDIQMSCSGYGDPSPAINIKKISVEEAAELVGSPEELGEDVPFGLSTFITTLRSVNKSEEGWYACHAVSKDGETKHPFYLEVVDLCYNVRCSRREHCFANTELLVGECRCNKCQDMELKPVCGNDCTTYRNYCHLRQAACEKKIPLRKESEGVCNVENATVSVQETDVTINKGDSLSLTCKVTGNPAPANVRWIRRLGGKRVQTVSTSNVFTLENAKGHRSGEYQCVARQCFNKLRSDVVTIRVENNVVDEPVPVTKTCKIYGDPHIWTFDGSRIDYQGQCTYMLAMDCQASTWMLMGRFMNCGAGVSCLEDLTLWLGATSINMGRGWLVGENGSKFRMRRGQTVTLAGNVQVKYTGLSLVVKLNNGVKIVYDGFWGVTVTVPTDAVTCGICSNNNGNPEDDLYTARYSYGDHSIEEFAESWKVGRRRCYSESEDATRVDQASKDCGAANATCDSIINDPIFDQCFTKLGRENYLADCKMDMCYAEVPRFEGSESCAYINSLAQHCDEAGVPLPTNYMEHFECDVAELQDAVYNSGCPLFGVPAFIDEQ